MRSISIRPTFLIFILLVILQILSFKLSNTENSNKWILWLVAPNYLTAIDGIETIIDEGNLKSEDRGFRELSNIIIRRIEEKLPLIDSSKFIVEEFINPDLVGQMTGKNGTDDVFFLIVKFKNEMQEFWDLNLIKKTVESDKINQLKTISSIIFYVSILFQIILWFVDNKIKKR